MLHWPGLCSPKKISLHFFLAPNGQFPRTFEFDTRGSKVVSVAKFPGNSSTGSYLTPIFMCFHPHIIVKSWFRLYQMKHFQEMRMLIQGLNIVYQMKIVRHWFGHDSIYIVDLGLDLGLIQFIYLLWALLQTWLKCWKVWNLKNEKSKACNCHICNFHVSNRCFDGNT